MDINKRINDIILKYELDRYYPRFRKKLLGEKAVIKWAKEMAGRQILCVAADTEDINYFSHLFYNAGKEFSYCHYKDTDEKSIDKFDCIAVISKNPKQELLLWCRKQEKPVIYLYDYLELQGIFCEDELHKVIGLDARDMLKQCFPGKSGWREVVLIEFFEQKKRFELASQEQYKLLCAQKLFFLSLYIRNFIQAEKYQKILEKMGDVSSKAAWREIQALLGEIRRRLQERKSPDIVMVWMDAVDYGSGKDMPYLQKQIKAGISFESAFTAAPYTNATARTLFLGKTLIDGGAYREDRITEDNSPVIQDLKSHGYLCKVISGYLQIFEQEFKSYNYHELCSPCSAMFWDMLYNILSAKAPVFLLVHALTESHAPHLTARMTEENFVSWRLRVHKGRQELDEQMQYYMEYLGQETKAIFMSDHGQACMRDRLHTYFVVVGKDFQHRRAKELFSYVDFPKLLHGMLEGDTLEQPLFDREYVEVQMMDYYNPILIADLIKYKPPLVSNYFGYFGVITKEYLYLKYHIGNEVLSRWDSTEFDPQMTYRPTDVCDESMLPYFRKIVGKREFNITKNEKFKYTRYLYKLYDRFREKRKKVSERINGFFQQYPERSIALRMGGWHTAQLYHELTPENQKRIACIVDRDSNCFCSYIGLPVIPVERMENAGLEAVVLSSFEFLEVLRKEAVSYPEGIAIIDIYKSLEEEGVRCSKSFYETNYMTDEDYEVGFPFEELEEGQR